jgi:hypothetical protein
MEHRWGERFPIRTSVRLGKPHAPPSCLGHFLDLSVSGAAISAVCDLKERSMVLVTIVLSQMTTHVLDAHVVRRYPGGLAVEWCEFASPPVLELLRSASSNWRALKPAVTNEVWNKSTHAN